jgi:hypothetical protein
MATAPARPLRLTGLAWLAAGNEWPGGEGQELVDFLGLIDRHPCRKPWGRIANLITRYL